MVKLSDLKLDTLSVSNWVNMLTNHPELEQLLGVANINGITIDDAVELILANPLFIDKVLESGISKGDFDDLDIVDIVSDHTQLSSYFKVGKLNLDSAAILISRKPEFAIHFNLMKFKELGIVKILRSTPEFDKQLNTKLLSDLSWVQVLCERPDLVADFDFNLLASPKSRYEMLLRRPDLINVLSLEGIVSRYLARLLKRHKQLQTPERLALLNAENLAYLEKRSTISSMLSMNEDIKVEDMEGDILMRWLQLDAGKLLSFES